MPRPAGVRTSGADVPERGAAVQATTGRGAAEATTHEVTGSHILLDVVGIG
jgi:hypothetical protein